MDIIRDAAEIIKSARKHPIRVFCTIVLAFFLWASFSFIKSFCGQKGKQHAISQDEKAHTIPVTPKKKQKQVNGSKKSDSAPKIYQRTEGDQSPAIVGDDVEITYGTPKRPEDKKTEH